MMIHTHANLAELPLSTIRPEGWLRAWLETQRHGLTGHMEVAGFPFDTPGWSEPKPKRTTGADWWPLEQTAYWVDGALRCGHLLDDPSLTQSALKQIEYTLEHADQDGFLGPKFLKEPGEMHDWAHVVFFRALMARHSAAGDKRMPRAMKRHYLGHASDFAHDRDVCNVEPMLWTYSQTGDQRLLRLAQNAYDQFSRNEPEHACAIQNMLSDNRSECHGVTFNETAKLPALLFSYTGKRRYLRAAMNAYDKLYRDSGLIDGICSSSEGLRGRSPLDSHETCDIADQTWSLGYLLLATGDAAYADAIERACFNAAPGAVRSDFKALQYFSCPNQVIADSHSNHNEMNRGRQWMCFRPQPATECCPGNVNRIMPNYVSRMWMQDRKQGLVAALYGPGRVAAHVGESRTPVTIEQRTSYPFSEEIDFVIHAREAVRFALSLRVPGWCRAPRLAINGRPLDQRLIPGTFVRLNRLFKPNDCVTITLPMNVRVINGPKGGGSAIVRGPLVYSLAIDEDWQIEPSDPNQTRDFPSWNVYAKSPWNYALAVNPKHVERDIQVVHNSTTSRPWSAETAPIEMHVPARRIRGWSYEKRNRMRMAYWRNNRVEWDWERDKYVMTPDLPNPASLSDRLGKRVEIVKLLPYGCTNLRMTLLPHLTQTTR